jgi:thioredoxin 1
MGAAKSLTKESFAETVGSGVTLVDFWAEWCGPCKAIAPIIEQLATEYEGKATVAKVNVDEDQELALDFGVQSIPTLLVIKDGKEVNRLIGVKPKAALAEALNSALA